MAVEFRIISIGTLSHHRLWGESKALRAPHATVTLVEADDRRILVDPSLPAEVLASRFAERTGRGLDSVTDVLCTTLRTAHRRGLEALENARWWASETELDTFRTKIAETLSAARRLDEAQTGPLEKELELLERVQPAPETFHPQVSLYPLPGPTPGCSGLLLTPATATVVIASDAALTREHVEMGQVWAGCQDTDQAATCLRDMLELADVIVPGHDNVQFLHQRFM